MKYKVFDLAYEYSIAEFDTREDAQEFILSIVEEHAYVDYLIRVYLDGDFPTIEEYMNYVEGHFYKEYDHSTFYAHALDIWDGYMIIEE